MHKKNIASTLKVPLKGYVKESIKIKETYDKRGTPTIKRLTLPVSFVKGEQNPIKLKKTINDRLTRKLGVAMSKLK